MDWWTEMISQRSSDKIDPSDKIDLSVVIDAVNAIDDRDAIIKALREREPRVRWYVNANGRLDASGFTRMR